MVLLRYIGSHQPQKEVDIKKPYMGERLVKTGEYEYVNKDDRSISTRSSGGDIKSKKSNDADRHSSE